MKARYAVALAACSALPHAARAVEYAAVVSSTPVIVDVTVPRSSCAEETRVVQPQPSGAGAVVGAIAGGLLGSAFGSGGGQAAATGLGAIAGAVVGNQAEANANPPVEIPIRRCRTVGVRELRTVGYDIVYEYGGERYGTRVARDPGARIAVTVAPADADAESVPVPLAAAPTPVPRVGRSAPLAAAAPAPAPVTSLEAIDIPAAGESPEPVDAPIETVEYQRGGYVYRSMPYPPTYVYPAWPYYGPSWPYYAGPAIGLSLGYTWGRNWHGHGHGHGRGHGSRGGYGWRR